MDVGSTIAIVVGIDHYEFVLGHRLEAPRRDALSFANWLIQQGIPESNLKLFLSSKSWDEPEVVQWIEDQKWSSGRRNATLGEITNFFNRELLLCSPSTVLVFWGGHGFVDSDNKQHMYLADASEQIPYSLSVDDIIGSLTRHEMGKIAERVLIVDACAELYASLPGDRRFISAPIARDYDSISYTKHISGYAASPGRVSSGAFSKLVLKRLESISNGCWPDFAKLLTEVVFHLVEHDASKERPRVEIVTPAGGKIFPSGEDTPLVSALQAIGQIPTENTHLYRLYVCSLPQSADALGLSSTVEKFVGHLHDLNPRNAEGPGPLIEFMMRLVSEIEHDALRKWIQRNVTAQWQAQIRAIMSKQATVSSTSFARLFIEIDAPNEKVRWYVQDPDPSRYSPVEELHWNERLEDKALSCLFTYIVNTLKKTPSACDHPVAIGLLLTNKQLTAGIEATPVVLEDDDLGSVCMPLFHCFPVILHWRRRVVSKSAVANNTDAVGIWRTLLNALDQQMKQSGSAAIKWLLDDEFGHDPEQLARSAASYLSNEKNSEIAIGFPYPSSGSHTHLQQIIDSCLRHGIPGFSWASAQQPAKAAIDGSKIMREFAKQTPSKAPLAVAKYVQTCARENTPSQALRILWDDDRMLPAFGSYSMPKDNQ